MFLYRGNFGILSKGPHWLDKKKKQTDGVNQRPTNLMRKDL